MKSIRERRPDLVALVSHWNEPRAWSDAGCLPLARVSRMTQDPATYARRNRVSVAVRRQGAIPLLPRSPYEFDYNGAQYGVRYLPGESDGGLFGGNSNWRGPIWMPVNYLLVENLRRFHLYYGEELTDRVSDWLGYAC